MYIGDHRILLDHLYKIYVVIKLKPRNSKCKYMFTLFVYDIVSYTI